MPFTLSMTSNVKLKTLTMEVNDSEKHRIFNYLTKISKNVYNATIFCILVYNKYKQAIFKEIFELIKNESENEIRLLDSKENIEYVAKTIDNSKIAENDYNLSVSSYVETKDHREKFDIFELNNKVSKTVARIEILRADIDKIIKEIEA